MYGCLCVWGLFSPRQSTREHTNNNNKRRRMLLVCSWINRSHGQCDVHTTGSISYSSPSCCRVPVHGSLNDDWHACIFISLHELLDGKVVAMHAWTVVFWRPENFVQIKLTEPAAGIINRADDESSFPSMQSCTCFHWTFFWHLAWSCWMVK